MRRQQGNPAGPRSADSLLLSCQPMWFQGRHSGVRPSPRTGKRRVETVGGDTWAPLRIYFWCLCGLVLQRPCKRKTSRNPRERKKRRSSSSTAQRRRSEGRVACVSDPILVSAPWGVTAVAPSVSSCTLSQPAGRLIGRFACFLITWFTWQACCSRPCLLWCSGLATCGLAPVQGPICPGGFVMQPDTSP